MPYESVLPKSFPSWDIDLGWPRRDYVVPAVGSPVATSDSSRYRRQQPGNLNSATYMQDIAGNSTVPNYAVQNGLFCVTPMPQPTIRPSALFYCDCLTIVGPFDSQGFAPGDGFPSAVPIVPYRRVYIDEFLVCFSTAAIGALGNLEVVGAFTPDTTTVATNVWGNTGHHYGLRCDGAGGIEFYSVVNSVVTEATTITWPVGDFRQWVKVAFEHVMASDTGPAQLRVLLNDTPLLTRAWGAGSVLPNLVAFSFRHMRRYFGQYLGRPQGVLFYTNFRSRAGRYTIDGTELL